MLQLERKHAGQNRQISDHLQSLRHLIHTFPFVRKPYSPHCFANYVFGLKLYRFRKIYAISLLQTIYAGLNFMPIMFSTPIRRNASRWILNFTPDISNNFISNRKTQLLPTANKNQKQISNS